MVSHRYSSVRNTHITEEIRSLIASTQTGIKSAQSDTNTQLIRLQGKIEEINESSDEEDAGEPLGPRKDKLLQQLEEERRALSVSQKLLDDLLLKAHEDAVAWAAAKNQGITSTVYTVTFGDNNSGMQSGVVNGTVTFNAR